MDNGLHTVETATDASLPGRMAAKIVRQKEMGYRFALVYVTPEEKLEELREGTLDALRTATIKINASIGSDNTKLARGDADHEFFLAQWDDPFGIQAARDAAAKRIRDVEDKARAKAEAAAAKLARATARLERKASKEAEAAAKKEAAARKMAKTKRLAKAKAKAKADKAKTPKTRRVN